MEHEPVERLPDKPHDARKKPTPLFNDPKMTQADKTAKARAIMASPALYTLTQSEINELIVNLGDLSWDETQVIARRYRSRNPIPAPVKIWYPGMPGMEDENHSCPEKLPKARGGPGSDLGSDIYNRLALPRLSPGVEKVEPWSESTPPSVLPDTAYGDERLEKWSTYRSDADLFRSQWADQIAAELKAYEDTSLLFPIVQDGNLTFTTESDKIVYNPRPTSFEGCGLTLQPGEVWSDWKIESRVSSYSVPNSVARKQFTNWFNQLPNDPQVVDIFRTSFFDGSAMSDGVSAMFLPDIKHLPTPRNMKDKMTSLHWHETSQGYAYNWSPANQKRIKDEEERKLEQRRMAPFQAWLNLPPGSKVVPPNIFLRPAEHYDLGTCEEIMQWYTDNSFVSGDLSPMKKKDWEQLLSTCRDAKLPFVVAAMRLPWKYHNEQIDPAIGFAYVKHHRPNNGADASMGELQVFVQDQHKKRHIGRALVHKIISCFETDVHAAETKDYDFDKTGTVQYGPCYSESPTTLICVVADTPGPKKENAWVKQWLSKDFGFKEMGVFKDARTKFGRTYVHTPCPTPRSFLLTRSFRFDLCYMAHQINYPKVKEEPKVRVKVEIKDEIMLETVEKTIEVSAVSQQAGVDCAPLIDLFD
ncbi:unnamed protein product [Penicillium salamii]|uniref:Acyl-CoA N-acyltransferase n=1 Tax=Penicillium salamii TaxID=1612424 RepID=A0A9W4JEL2_9EURO|nr:unnamed protein product [Penicillium salamii]CAG7982267.1 unnamed protein product [Penicillium salamii]CAG8027164.1 unnamed protein product [Penicillium salamii]CAG8075258.1 unnamed protein product [Penicillium salamii]CAG8081210.1 unnamed protein product [Penicillium salamii]